MRISDLPLISDVKDEYLLLRKRGESRAEAIRTLTQSFQNEIENYADEDGMLFWIGLADGMHSNKELTSEIAERGLQSLNTLEQTDWEVTPGDINRRKIRYAEPPKPERNMSRKRRVFRCEWQIGDTFALKITETKCEDLLGKYALIRKLSEIELWDDRVIPIVSISIWDKPDLPQNASEFLESTLIILDARNWPMPPGTYVYRAELEIKTKKQLENLSLQWVGNFDVPMPKNEYVYPPNGPARILFAYRLVSDIEREWNNHKIYCEWDQNNLN